MDAYWMVFQDGEKGQKPKKKHQTKTLACMEAMRLANLNAGVRFVVMEVIAEYKFNADPV